MEKHFSSNYRTVNRHSTARINRRRARGQDLLLTEVKALVHAQGYKIIKTSNRKTGFDTRGRLLSRVVKVTARQDKKVQVEDAKTANGITTTLNAHCSRSSYSSLCVELCV